MSLQPCSIGADAGTQAVEEALEIQAQSEALMAVDIEAKEPAVVEVMASKNCFISTRVRCLYWCVYIKNFVARKCCASRSAELRSVNSENIVMWALWLLHARLVQPDSLQAYEKSISDSQTNDSILREYKWALHGIALVTLRRSFMDSSKQDFLIVTISNWY
jgi:hypothetical protein